MTEAGRSVHAEEVAELRALLEEARCCSFLNLQKSWGRQVTKLAVGHS